MGILLRVVVISVITCATTDEPMKQHVSNATETLCSKLVNRKNIVRPFAGESDVVEYMVKIAQRLHLTEVVVVSDKSEVLSTFFEYAQEAFIKLYIYNSMQTFFDDIFFYELQARSVLVLGTESLQKNALQKMQEIPDLFGPFSPLVVETFWLCLLDPDLLRVIDVKVLKIYNFAAFLRSIDNGLTLLKTLLWTQQGRQFSTVTADFSTMTASILYPNVNFGLNGALLRAGINEWYPFIKASGQNGNKTYVGYCIDLLDLFASSLNFSYELVLAPDNEYGDFTNGSWTGLVGLIERKKVDIVVAAMSPSEQRQNVVDWTVPFEYIEVGIIFKYHNGVNRWKTYLSPFAWEVYAYILGTFAFSAVILLSAHAASCWLQGDPADFCLPEVVQFLLGSLLNQASTINWTFGVTRFLALCWCLMVLVLTSSFTGKLTSLLVSVPAPLPFTSWAELAANDDFRVGILGGGLGNLHLRISNDSTFQTLYRKVMTFAKEDPDVLSRYQHVHQRKILAGHYAYIGDRTMLENEEASMTDDIIFLPLKLNGLSTASVFLPKHSSLREMTGSIITNLEEMGFLTYLRKRWFKTGNRRQEAERPSSTSKVTLEAVQGPLYVACGGLLLAGVITLVERKIAATRTKTFCVMKSAPVSDT